MPTVITKKSTVALKVPLNTDLQVGELAVNTADKKLYSKHSDNSVVEIGFKPTVGVSGITTAVLDMYQWAASTPTVFPTGSSTVNLTTAQFTPPYSQGVAYELISLWLKGNGTNGASVITDESLLQLSPTITGTVTTSTTVSKFNGSAIKFNKTGELTYSSGFNFGTADFTISCWVNFTSASGVEQRGPFQLSTSSGYSTLSSNIAAFVTTGGYWAFYANGSRTTTTPVSTNTWYHLAICRKDGVTRIFVDGGLLLSFADTFNYSGTYGVIGGYYSSTYRFDGYINDFVAIKGTSLYNGAFTPPTIAFDTPRWATYPGKDYAGNSLWTTRVPVATNSISSTLDVVLNSSTAELIKATGVSGERTAVLELYQWAASTPSTFPSGTSTYTWGTGTFTLPATLNSWNILPGPTTTNYKLYGCRVVVNDTGSSSTSSISWTTSTAYEISGIISGNYDSEPISGSLNAVTSGGLYNYFNSNIKSPTSIQFGNGSAQTTSAGKAWYDETTGAFNLGMGGGNITQQVGEEVFTYGKASAAITGQTLLQVIYKTGTVGASGVITFGPVVSGITDPNLIVGVGTENIALNGFGRVTSFGIVRGINTSGSTYSETWADNDTIWYKASTGTLTNVKPTSGILVSVGTVIIAHASAGSIQVKLLAYTDLSAPGAIGGTTPSTINATTVTATGVTVSGGTVTASTPVVNTTQTWNNAAIAFTAKVNNVTNTASAAASFLEDWQVGGASKFKIDKNGYLYFKGGSGGLVRLYTTEYGDRCFFASGPGTTDSTGVRIQNGAGYYWATSTDASGTAGHGLVNSSSGVLEINNGTTGTFRDLKLRNQITTGSISTGLSSKTADYTLTANDGTITADSTSTAITLTLETAVGHNRIHCFKKTAGSNTVTIDGNASETIDGAASITLTDRCILQSNGTEWKQIA